MTFLWNLKGCSLSYNLKIVKLASFSIVLQFSFSKRNPMIYLQSVLKIGCTVMQHGGTAVQRKKIVQLYRYTNP